MNEKSHLSTHSDLNLLPLNAHPFHPETCNEPEHRHRKTRIKAVGQGIVVCPDDFGEFFRREHLLQTCCTSGKNELGVEIGEGFFKA